MALQIGRALQGGIDEFLSERGAAFAGAFIVFGLVNSIVWVSLSQGISELFLESLPPSSGANPAAVAETTPLAFDIPVAVAAVSALALFVVSETLSIVAIRAFASDSTNPIPVSIDRGLGRAVLRAIAVSVLSGVVVVIGFFLFIIPGLVIGLFIFIFLFFVKQEIALNDSGVVESIRNSVDIVGENLIAAGGLAILLAVLSFIIGLGIGFFPTAIPPMISTTVSTVVSGIMSVFGIAVTTVAYLQATESDHDIAQETESVGGL